MLWLCPYFITKAVLQTRASRVLGYNLNLLVSALRPGIVPKNLVYIFVSAQKSHMYKTNLSVQYIDRQYDLKDCPVNSSKSVNL